MSFQSARSPSLEIIVENLFHFDWIQMALMWPISSEGNWWNSKAPFIIPEHHNISLAQDHTDWSFESSLLSATLTSDDDDALEWLSKVFHKISIALKRSENPW